MGEIICLKSDYNNKFLRYRYEDVRSHGPIQSAADQVLDPYVQFEVEKSETYDGLVHLKSRYNNKYLVRWSAIHDWISASANKVDEDQSNWTCTLFKLIHVDDNDTKKIRLLHVQLNRYGFLRRNDDIFASCLSAGSNEVLDKESGDVFTYINWESVFSLPKRVAFKGDNGKYLGAFEYEGTPYLQFSSDDNVNDPRDAHETFETPDGTVCIKSTYFGKFWRLSNNEFWVVVDADDPRKTGDVRATFRHNAVRDVNVITLLCMTNSLFCKRYTAIMENCLNASAADLQSEESAILEVIDLGAVTSNM